MFCKALSEAGPCSAPAQLEETRAVITLTLGGLYEQSGQRRSLGLRAGQANAIPQPLVNTFALFLPIMDTLNKTRRKPLMTNTY